jgi:hypothetical protein
MKYKERNHEKMYYLLINLELHRFKFSEGFSTERPYKYIKTYFGVSRNFVPQMKGQLQNTKLSLWSPMKTGLQTLPQYLMLLQRISME